MMPCQSGMKRCDDCSMPSKKVQSQILLNGFFHLGGMICILAKTVKTIRAENMDSVVL